MRDFLKIAAASAVGTLVGLFSLVLLLGIGAFGLVSVLLVSSSSETEVEIEDQSVLMFDLSTDIVDGDVSGTGRLFDESFYGVTPSISLYDALQAIAAAAEDDRISGIYLTGMPAEGLATLKEIRAALKDFKTSGKPILAYSTGLKERDYYMASVADDLLLAPVGLLEINGFRAETQFLGNALKKYGVGVQVVRAGRYKSAVEPFTRSQSSPEEKQQTEVLVTSLWQDFLNTVTDEREVTPTQMQTYADEVGLIEPEQALASGLVDRLGFYTEMLSELKKLAGEADSSEDASAESWAEADEPEFANVTLSDYARTVARDRNSSEDKDAIAVVYAQGNIIVGEGSVPGAITSEGLSATLRDMREDDDIKAVVLRVNSPGGSATASEIIANEVRLLADEKPLVVSMGDYAASGGYMIAAPGAKILASPTTITGSIGVYGLLLNFQEIANENGITWDDVKTAQLAGMGTVSRPKTASELKVQQDYVDTLYTRFTSLVAEGRDISMARVGQVAQGRVWTGEEAINADLVDELGGLNDAIALAAQTAKIEEFKVEEYPRIPSFEEQLLDSLFGAEMITRLPWNKDPLTDQLLKLREDFKLLERLNDPTGMYMRLPFTTEIE
ncbi:signal peptide peptidase SppA, 67K type [Synechococcus sp. PCC 7335]|uniref:signal peptide peptidase SppA n=1 Tax=Synechococcus sp. (strain ATCC 29403 / PCC 7335) TaxID=91464 RepID=UPI00017EDCC7|nr:signal peptide peptidase SppA [Synechococcus sp. PCC 7335]EDX85477.1 signal peptide peptidase SppA, 67K type [Synechococcus sp. PCC 7335]